MTEPGPRFYFAAVAVIDGWPAYYLARIVTRRGREDIEDLPPALRAPVEECLRAMRLAGEAWASGRRGNPEAGTAETAVPSDGQGDEMTTKAAATMLEVTERRVRQLIADGTLTAHKRGGRQMLDRGAVTAYHDSKDGQHE